MALSGSLVSLATVVAIYALFSLGLNIKFGFNGLLDIGHVTFFLIGAYVTALLVIPSASTQELATYVLGLNWPWIPAVIVAVLVAGAAGMLIALPAIRLREDYLAIVLLGFSVIALRVVQTQGWLANGPRSLRGYDTPLVDLFPLPGTGLASAVVFGAIVLLLWTIGTYVLTRVMDDEQRGTPKDRIARVLYAVTTVGVGYVAAELATERDESITRFAAGAGLAAGVATAALTVAGFGLVATLVFLGGFSLFTWVVVVSAVVDRYQGISRLDALYGLGMTIALVVALLPVIILGGGGSDASGSLGLFGTVALLAVFLYGLYYTGTHWQEYGSSTAFVRVVGIGVLWAFALRYFVFALVTPFKRGGVMGAANDLVQNLLWLIDFGVAGVQFDYARFVLVVCITVLALTYYVLEITVYSPFGRVLKAIREDEDVATALGKNTFVFKVQSMILGSAVAGLSGALWALSTRTLVYTMFRPRITFAAFLILIIGGTANNRGIVLGAAIFWIFQRATQDLATFFPSAARSSVQALRLAVIGALLIIILYYQPEGIWPERTEVTDDEPA
jgi:ABC-type branched-subunit amino acid transport system permease subunit